MDPSGVRVYAQPILTVSDVDSERALLITLNAERLKADCQITIVVGVEVRVES